MRKTLLMLVVLVAAITTATSYGSTTQVTQSAKLQQTVEESIQIAVATYPQFTEARAWCLIKHESWMVSDPLHAVNRIAIHGEHATGLYQFLPSTFHSTPYGHLSIYSAYAQSMAAGWMHSHGRGNEWSTCR